MVINCTIIIIQIIRFNNVNQNIEYRRNTLKYPQPTNEELQEITNCKSI